MGPGAGRPTQLTLSRMPAEQLRWQPDSPGRGAQVFLPPLWCRLGCGESWELQKEGEAGVCLPRARHQAQAPPQGIWAFSVAER